MPFSHVMRTKLISGANTGMLLVTLTSLACSSPRSEPAATADCDSTTPSTCVSQATALLESGNGTDAVGMLDAACERFHAPSCRTLGVWKRDGMPEAQLAIKTVASLLTRAASQGDVEASYELGVTYRDGLQTEASPRAAADKFEFACRRDHALACYDLGMLLTQGALPLDIDKAGMAFLTGCGLGEGSSCWNVATMAKQGAFTLPDDLTVDGLMERACAQGAEGACGG